MTVTAIKIIPQQDLTNLAVTVSESPEKPAGLPDPEGVAVSYITITASGVEAGGRAMSGAIHFRVDKARARELGVDIGDIALYRFEDNWVKLETKMMSGDENYAYFEAETHAFSVFTIAGRAAPPVTIAPPFPIAIVLGASAVVIIIAFIVLLLRRRKR